MLLILTILFHMNGHILDQREIIDITRKGLFSYVKESQHLVNEEVDIPMLLFVTFLLCLRAALQLPRELARRLFSVSGSDVFVGLLVL